MPSRKPRRGKLLGNLPHYRSLREQFAREEAELPKPRSVAQHLSNEAFRTVPRAFGPSVEQSIREEQKRRKTFPTGTARIILSPKPSLRLAKRKIKQKARWRK